MQGEISRKMKFSGSSRAARTGAKWGADGEAVQPGASPRSPGGAFFRAYDVRLFSAIFAGVPGDVTGHGANALGSQKILSSNWRVGRGDTRGNAQGCSVINTALVEKSC